jgi:type IV pilus assembly protein PilA
MLKQLRDFFAKVFKKENGFTLIELLATLVIIGIITGIAVPAIGNVVSDSRNKAQVTEALMIIDAAKLARAENPDQTTWNDLEDYLSKVKDTSWTVKYSDTSGYSIQNHEAVVGTTVTEQDLVNQLD